ncbi:uncharacterized protein K452DRAFT_296586 [Aplosporella prunicola CBS 121167]|uniref:Apple domain-containing protein n=1 Tax=Aplosporella prunicola CBS 121167 TaxID=1176127 RepID=A0A6A6BHF1_9PEZI|nr:uncharacterized protein K452DRAFT_296586 [Aplosporella prunicola CBS 121167]KAF2143579.1 hypothetical protein K452DRAFT_296586 [Aplosporella prunicola CBS 121167]
MELPHQHQSATPTPTPTPSSSSPQKPRSASRVSLSPLLSTVMDGPEVAAPPPHEGPYVHDKQQQQLEQHAAAAASLQQQQQQLQDYHAREPAQQHRPYADAMGAASAKDPSGTGTGTGTGTNAADCPAVNGEPYTIGNVTFVQLCGLNVCPETCDIVGADTKQGSFAECMDYCAEYNRQVGAQKCSAVAWDYQQVRSSFNNKCWLKLAAGPLVHDNPADGLTVAGIIVA